MDAASVLGIVVAAVAVATLGWGVYTARRGWSEDLSIRKADFVRNYTHDFYSAPELPKIVFDINYGRFAFGEHDLGGQPEVDLHQLLDVLNTVGLAVVHGIVAVDDLRQTTIGYAARIVWQDPSITWYLHQIDEAYPNDGTVAFAHFRELGRSLSTPRSR